MYVRRFVTRTYFYAYQDFSFQDICPDKLLMISIKNLRQIVLFPRNLIIASLKSDICNRYIEYIVKVRNYIVEMNINDFIPRMESRPLVKSELIVARDFSNFPGVTKERDTKQRRRRYRVYDTDHEEGIDRAQ